MLLLTTTFAYLLIIGLLEEGRLPAPDMLVSGRRNTEGFHLFCDVFLSRVVGVTEWRESCTSVFVTDMASVSDEAFAILCIENYWDEWANKNVEEYKSEVAFDATTNTRKKRKTTWGIYTKGATGSRRYGGWSAEGLERFNVLYEKVVQDRRDNAAASNVLYKTYCEQREDSGKKKRKVVVNTRSVVVRSDDVSHLL